ncbi:MAG: glycine cleavage T C-terminal barrel domain-containing protein [Vicinamibacterales bacterium]
MTDLHAYELGDVLLLVLPLATTSTVLAKLDQFIFSEDVQLGDVTQTFATIAVVGPEAAPVIATALEWDPSVLRALPEHGNVRQDAHGQPAVVLRISDAGVDGFDLIVAREALAATVERLHTAGAVDVDDETADILRIEAGVPLFGHDMDEETIPLEAGIESRAISFTKGCYVGQEIVIRVLHRGHGRVARKLVGLVLPEGIAAPARGSALAAGDKEIGRVTSSCVSPRLGRAIALGYVKREIAEAATPVTTASGDTAAIVTLPFAAS